jgi:ribosomal protein L19E
LIDQLLILLLLGKGRLLEVESEEEPAELTKRSETVESDSVEGETDELDANEFARKGRKKGKGRRKGKGRARKGKGRLLEVESEEEPAELTKRSETAESDSVEGETEELDANEFARKGRKKGKGRRKGKGRARKGKGRLLEVESEEEPAELTKRSETVESDSVEGETDELDANEFARKGRKKGKGRRKGKGRARKGKGRLLEVEADNAEAAE